MQNVDTSGKGMIHISKTQLYLLIAFIVLLAGAVVYLSVFTDIFDGNEPGNLPLNRAKSMVQCYHNQFKDVPEDSIVWSVYFDYHEMMSYLQKMHNKHGANGIRIYFAKYDISEPRPFKPAPCDPPGTATSLDLKGYCTVVVIPTIKNDSGRIIDLIVTKKQHANELVDVKSIEQPTSQPQNGGISCPPYPPSVCGGQLLKGSPLSKADSAFLLKHLPD